MLKIIKNCLPDRSTLEFQSSVLLSNSLWIDLWTTRFPSESLKRIRKSSFRRFRLFRTTTRAQFSPSCSCSRRRAEWFAKSEKKLFTLIRKLQLKSYKRVSSYFTILDWTIILSLKKNADKPLEMMKIIMKNSESLSNYCNGTKLFWNNK
jgi:hypothetical protein